MEDENPWGWTLSINLYDCDPLRINNRTEIKRYAKEICDVIEMQRYGEPIIEWFGSEERVKGFTLLQLIETSSITGHFCESKSSAYIDIFSCKSFDTPIAVNFTKNFFGSKRQTFNLLVRE